MQNEDTEKYVLNKELEKITQKKGLHDTEMSNLPEKEFKVTGIDILTKCERRMDKHSENYKETENIRKRQTEVTELKNAIIELKNTLQESNNRLDAAEK